MNRTPLLLTKLIEAGVSRRRIAKSLGWDYDKLDLIFEKPDLYITLRRMQWIAFILNISVEEVMHLCLPPERTADILKAKLDLVHTAVIKDFEDKA